MECVICEKKASYKCPKCLSRYCSLACFKVHKEVSCSRESITKSDKRDDLTPDPMDLSKVINDPLEEMYLPPQVLDRIRNSDKCIDILNNSRLQELLISIHNSDEKEQMLDRHLTNNEEFSEVIDVILKEIGLRDEEGVSIF